MFKRFSLYSLIALNFILLCTFLMQACKKDGTVPDQMQPALLTIEEARQVFDSKIQYASMRDSTPEMSVVPDWDHAVSYFDTIKQQAVVEMPILKDWLSLDLLNPENVTVDTALFLQTPQNHRLVIVRNAQGVVDIAIMKIAGTYKYTFVSGGLATANTYRHLNNQFRGTVSYVDIDDQIFSSYYLSSGQYY